MSNIDEKSKSSTFFIYLGSHCQFFGLDYSSFKTLCVYSVNIVISAKHTDTRELYTHKGAFEVQVLCTLSRSQFRKCQHMVAFSLNRKYQSVCVQGGKLK